MKPIPGSFRSQSPKHSAHRMYEDIVEEEHEARTAGHGS